MTRPTVSTRIRPRDRDTILQALRAGVVPRTGVQHVAVGRHDETKSLVTDIARIADGGSACRFVIGDYGSGKTFFLQLVRTVALQKNLLTVHADLAPDRRLQSTGGQARSLFAELMKNLSTRAQPDGGAMTNAVEKFISTALAQAQKEQVDPEKVIHSKLEHLSELVGGYDFAQVIAAYWRGHDTDNDQLRADAVRWLRAEFATKTDARAALGVRSIIDDSQFYDQLKLMARFARVAGFSGLLVCLDEMVNLYKLASTQARSANYEQILRMLNDALQGSCEHLGVVFGGTPEFLTDTRRGLYSYEALRSRLAENTFAGHGLVDFSGPVLRLENLTPEDLYQLLKNLRHVHASGDPEKYAVPDEALTAYMEHCRSHIGDAYFRTPRNTVRSFLDLLAVLDHNPGLDWRRLLGDVRLEPDRDPHVHADDPAADRNGDELDQFRL